MFDGALAPWHLVVIAFALFMLFGPKKIAAQTQSMRDAFRRFADGDDARTDGVDGGAATAKPVKRSRAYRVGQRLRRRRRVRR